MLIIELIYIYIYIYINWYSFASIINSHLIVSKQMYSMSVINYEL